MIKINAMDHIGLFIADARAAAKWYVENLGFKQIGAFTPPDGADVVFVRSEAAGVTYELIGLSKDMPAYAAIADGKAKVDHIAYSVDSVEDTFELAKKLGMDITDPITNIPEFWDNGFRYFKVRGPGGEIVELCKIL